MSKNNNTLHRSGEDNLDPHKVDFLHSLKEAYGIYMYWTRQGEGNYCVILQELDNRKTFYSANLGEALDKAVRYAKDFVRKNEPGVAKKMELELAKKLREKAALNGFSNVAYGCCGTGYYAEFTVPSRKIGLYDFYSISTGTTLSHALKEALRRAEHCCDIEGHGLDKEMQLREKIYTARHYLEWSLSAKKHNDKGNEKVILTP